MKVCKYSIVWKFRCILAFLSTVKCFIMKKKWIRYLSFKLEFNILLVPGT